MRPRRVKLAARRVALVAAFWMALLQAPALLGREAGARVAQANHVCGHAQAAECTPTATATRTPTRTPVTTPVPTAAPASATPTQAPVATPTMAPTSAPTQTVTAVAGGPTATALAGSTVTATVVVAVAATATPTGEAVSPTPVVTATQPAATATPLPTAIATPLPTATATATAGDRRALTVSGGAPGGFSATLAGSEQQVFTTLEAYTVRDGTNRADGWNLTVQAAVFTCAPGVGACPSGGDSLPAGSLFMAPPVVSCEAANQCSGRAAPPVVALAGPVAIDVSTAVRIASAAVGTGDGTYLFTPASLDSAQGHHLRLTLPASAYATTYGSTLTLTVAVGP